MALPFDIKAEHRYFGKNFGNSDARPQTVKKTLTIPKWLNDEAINKKINFSAVLKEALIEELHIR